MITCGTCLFANPMGTRWCRQCGAKLDLDARQIEAAVSATQVANADDRVLGWGRSALGVGVFVLLSAIIVRATLVPALPRADIPVQLPAQIIPVTERTTPASPGAASGKSSTSVPMLGERLRWRSTVCRALLSSLGLDLAALDRAADHLAAAQKSDGSFPGGDPLAATGLAVLGLQAWPSDERLAVAATSRAWLKTQLADATRRQPLGRALALAALDDAQDLPTGERARLQSYLIDGKAAQWQAWQIAGLTAADRPAEIGLVRDGLLKVKADALWNQLLDLGTDKRPAIEHRRFFIETIATPTGAIAVDDRPAWSLLAWQLTPAPADMTTVMLGWSRAPVPAVSAELAKAAGPTAAESMWLLTLAAPARLPPLWSGLAVP